MVEARGVKLQDFSLLQQCMESFGICSKCKNVKSRHKVFADYKKGKGLEDACSLNVAAVGQNEAFSQAKDTWKRQLI